MQHRLSDEEGEQEPVTMQAGHSNEEGQEEDVTMQVRHSHKKREQGRHSQEEGEQEVDITMQGMHSQDEREQEVDVTMQGRHSQEEGEQEVDVTMQSRHSQEEVCQVGSRNKIFKFSFLESKTLFKMKSRYFKIFFLVTSKKRETGFKILRKEISRIEIEF